MTDIVERLNTEIMGIEANPGGWDITPGLLEASISEIERLRAAQQWKPIETAPKDGTICDLWVCGARAPSCYWNDDDGLCGAPHWRQNYAEVQGCSFELPGIPTHWKPLPSPPAKEGE